MLTTIAPQTSNHPNFNLPAYEYLPEVLDWNELVFQVLSNCSTDEPEKIRAISALLNRMGLLNLRLLTNTENPSCDRGFAMTAVLKKCGFSELDAACAFSLLSQAARVLLRLA